MSPHAIASSSEQLARDALEAVLRTQWEKAPALRLDSPPGAGKTGVVERLAMQSMALLGERCMVVTQTNEQAFDLARRLAAGFPGHGFTLLVRDGIPLPRDLAARPNLTVAKAPKHLPDGPCVVIANSAKWARIDDSASPDDALFDLQVVDEAFQMPDYRFHQIANLARRLVLVGDPGQIAPVITAPIERWRGNAAGPHVPAPEALLHRHPGVPRLSLPVSRRLVPDTIRIVQPAFYPDLPFVALAAPGERRLTVASSTGDPMGRAIGLAASSASLVGLELPPTVPGRDDPELAAAMVALIEQLLERGARVVEAGEARPLRADRIGVVCAHVAQVHAVRERLAGRLAGVLVETADRFQGLERDVMLVHHPLSGRADVSEFHLDAGRLCVMLSRHRVACFVFMRGGIERQLLDYGLRGDRVLSLDRDREHEGWKAHLSVIQQMERESRTVAQS